jgi:hypothetical protein
MFCMARASLNKTITTGLFGLDKGIKANWMRGIEPLNFQIPEFKRYLTS